MKHLLCSTPAMGFCPEFDRNWKRIAGKRDLHCLSEERLQAVCRENGLSYGKTEKNGGVLYFESEKAAG